MQIGGSIALVTEAIQEFRDAAIQGTG